MPRRSPGSRSFIIYQRYSAKKCDSTQGERKYDGFACDKQKKTFGIQNGNQTKKKGRPFKYKDGSDKKNGKVYYNKKWYVPTSKKLPEMLRVMHALTK